MFGRLLRLTALTGMTSLAVAGVAAAASVCGFSPDGNEPQFGGLAISSGDFSFACGPNAEAYGGSTSIGSGAGSLSNPENQQNVAVGPFAGASVSGDGNVAVGTLAGRSVIGNDNVAIGQNAGSGSLSLVVDNTVAIGANSLAGQDNSIAIGAGVATTRAGQVAIGDADATYTLAGIGSPDSLAAQDPTSLRFVTSDLGGNLALSAFDPSSLATSASVTALDSRVTTLETGLGDLSSQLGETRDEARGGTALALAAAGLRYDDRPEKLSIAGGVGHFKGFTGLSFGVGYATSDTFRINAAISGVPELGDVGVSAGVSWTLN